MVLEPIASIANRDVELRAGWSTSFDEQHDVGVDPLSVGPAHGHENHLWIMLNNE